MDALEPVTPAKNVVTDDDNGIPESQPSPEVDGGVVLAQPAITLPAPVSKTPVLTVDADGTQSQKGQVLTCDIHSVYFKNIV